MALSDDYRRVSPPSTSAPYLALGILSSALERFQTHRGGETSGKFALRRETIRTSWLRHPAINHTISAHFILRCGGGLGVSMLHDAHECYRFCGHSVCQLSEPSGRSHFGMLPAAAWAFQFSLAIE